MVLMVFKQYCLEMLVRHSNFLLHSFINLYFIRLQCPVNGVNYSHYFIFFKKSKTCDVSYYRPISLTSVRCKIIESINKDEPLTCLHSKRLISRRQHGFYRSVVHNSLTV